MRPTRFAIVIALTAGCGNSSSSVDDIDQLYQQLASLLCQQQATCGGIAQSEVASCIQSALASINRAQVYDSREAIADHRLAFNSTQASACLDEFRAASCSGAVTALEGQACNDIFQPLVALGGVCRNNQECIGGGCSASSGCMGTCVAFVATGGDCSMAGTRCAPTDSCSFAGTTSTCGARAAAGAPCKYSSDCQAGLTCPAATGSSATCSEPGGVGAPCASPDHCTSGLYCTGSFQMLGTCQPRLAAGATCADQACVDGYVCAGSCTAWLAIGATCDPTASACPADAPCDATSKVCVAAPQAKVGDSCAGGASTCSSKDLFGNTLYCDGTSMTCAAKIDLGQPCTPPTNGASNPCYAGSCDATTHVCAAVCM